MKIQLEKGIWLRDKFFYGIELTDPPRTMIEKDAKEFETMEDALIALEKAREFKPFEDAEIQDDFL